MQNIFIQYVYLILIILALVMIANKLRIAYPIVLVLGGLVLSFTSAFSNITIDPELIFFIFLPPLLYEAAWQTSWNEFCFSHRDPDFVCGCLFIVCTYSRLYVGPWFSLRRNCISTRCHLSHSRYA